MARPVKCRRICGLPQIQEFIPSGQTCAQLVHMTVDEYETVRLIDQLGFSQEDCALQMHVARTTVQSIYDAARKKLAEMLIEGKRLQISGGTYLVCPNSATCCGRFCKKRKEKELHCENGRLLCSICARKKTAV